MSHRCALEKVHQRMDDANRFWHQAMQDYFDPDAFRAAFNACIQALRTVTWVLQGLKNDIDGLEQWYLPWQARMKQDRILRWVVEARNKIEHKGDIDAKSTVHAAVFASYYNELPHMDVNACIIDTVNEIFARIPKDILHGQIIEHGALRLERRWIDAELPDTEVLDALRHAYCELSDVIDDAHEQLLRKPCARTHGEARRRLDAMSEAGEQTRTTLISLKTGKEFALVKQHLPTSEKERALKRYGTKSIETFRELPASLTDAAHKFFEIAIHIFAKDGYHETMAFLMKDLIFFRNIGLRPPDRMSKYLMMRGVASEVEKTGATELIMVSEAWLGTYDPEKPFRYPSDQPNRTEALTLTACSNKGQIYSLSAAIVRRRFRKVTLGPTEQVDLGEPALLGPVFDVWGVAHAGSSTKD